jgi:hypothetical protein
MPRILLLLLATATITTSAPAQTATSADAPLPSGERVRVRVGAYPAFEGTLVRSDPDSLVVTTTLSGRDTTYAFPQSVITRLERHAGRQTRADIALLYGAGGALIAGGAGLVLDALLSDALDGDGESKSSGMPAVVALGFGLGFAIGLAQQYDKWVRVETPAGSITPILGVGDEVAVGVSLRW